MDTWKKKISLCGARGPSAWAAAHPVWFKTGDLSICQPRPSGPGDAAWRGTWESRGRATWRPLNNRPVRPSHSELLCGRPRRWRVRGQGQVCVSDHHASGAGQSRRHLLTLPGGSPCWTPPARLCHGAARPSVQHGRVDGGHGASKESGPRPPRPAARSPASCWPSSSLVPLSLRLPSDLTLCLPACLPHPKTCE